MPDPQTLSAARLLRGYSLDSSKRDLAYQRLRRLLILQQIPAGARLTEAEWTLRLNVNRTALREAFVRLEAEGLIERGLKTGYIVPMLTMQDIREILAVRFALESSAIEIVCRSGTNTAEHLARMGEACDHLERLCAEDYQLSTVEADWRFHESLIEATGNRRLAIAYHHAPVPILHPEITCGPRWLERVHRTIEEHRAILKTILAGEVLRAQELLRIHLVAYWETAEHSSQAAGGGQCAVSSR